MRTRFRRPASRSVTPLLDLAIAREVQHVPEADFTTLDFGETRTLGLR